MNQGALKSFFWINILLYITVQMVGAITPESCNDISRTNAQIERKLNGNGFHRDLETSIIFSTLEFGSCYVLIKERFLPGCYVDPNELNFLKEFGGPSFFIPQFVNVETPQQVSPEIQGYFFTQVELRPNIKSVVNITIPVHIRYHRSKRGPVRHLDDRVIFPHPNLYLLCENALEDQCALASRLEPCPPNGVQQCDWQLVDAFSTSVMPRAYVPVGNLDLIDTVFLTTTTVTFGATLLLLVSLFKNTRNPYLYNQSIT